MCLPPLLIDTLQHGEDGNMSKDRGRRLVAQNRKARYDYHIHDTYEAGIVLSGTEVKSLREGRANLTDAFATVDDGEVWLRGAHIPEYSHGTWTNHSARRTRKLLLNRREIAKIQRELATAGTTLVPLSLYFSDGYAKVEIALASGKREYDKRQTIAARESRREAERAMVARNRGQ
jgi:SsrA-binding protein